jgi:hypothetical protein
MKTAGVSVAAVAVIAAGCLAPASVTNAAGQVGAWTQAHPATVPEGRVNAASGYDGHQVVMFGGDDTNTHTVLGDTWTWDGANWAEQHPLSAPSPRLGATMDWDGRELVLFGGTSREGSFGSELHDTWTWDGSNWTEQHPTTSPRAGLTKMAYDGHGAIIFGGGDAHGDYVGETWRWTPGAWTQLMPAHSPSARDSQEMDFDPGRGVVLLTGGTSGGASLSDTWSWDGLDWTALGVSVHSSAGAMAFDGRNDLIIGTDSYAPSNTTYLWTGRGWQQQPASTEPPNGAAPALIFDPRSNSIVLFGGEGGANYTTSFDETWIWSETPAGGPTPPPPTGTSSAHPVPSLLPPTGASASGPATALSPLSPLPNPTASSAASQTLPSATTAPAEALSHAIPPTDGGLPGGILWPVVAVGLLTAVLTAVVLRRRLCERPGKH